MLERIGILSQRQEELRTSVSILEVGLVCCGHSIMFLNRGPVIAFVTQTKEQFTRVYRRLFVVFSLFFKLFEWVNYYCRLKRSDEKLGKPLECAKQEVHSFMLKCIAFP